MSWLKRHTLTAAIVCLLLAFALWHFYPGVPAQWVFAGRWAAPCCSSRSPSTRARRAPRWAAAPRATVRGPR